MLSMVSSLLPSTLSEKLEKLDMRPDQQQQKQQIHPQVKNDSNEDDDDGVKRKDMHEDTNKKEKKKKISHETFIIVRPPPQLHNHPLNLQIQLVPAIATRERPATSTGSMSSRKPPLSQPSSQSPVTPTSDSDTDKLTRRASIRSNRSDTSTFYSSSNTSSVTSFSSGTSTGSGRRMIIPLYNLHAHNVMTNTVFDAGTDARVAKFQRRGLEVLGLGILEPTEVWQTKEFSQGDYPIARIQTGASLAPPAGGRAMTPEFPHSPGSSRLSLGSDNSSQQPQPQPQLQPPQHQIPRNNTATSSLIPSNNNVNGAKRIFGKIFRRKEPSVTLSPPNKIEEEEVISIPVPSPRSPLSPSSPFPDAVRPKTVISKPLNNEIFLPAVLGVTPTLSSPVNQAIGRCVKHVWVMRKWLKAENDNRLTGIIRKVGREASAYAVGQPVDQGNDWMVRFEWTRGKSKREKAAARRAKRGSVDASFSNRQRSPTPSRRSSTVLNSEEADPIASSHSRNESTRMSRSEEVAVVAGGGDTLDVRPLKRSGSHSRPVTPRTPSPNPSRPAGSSANHSEEDSRGENERDEDSDPEDSETPWVCNMIVTQTGSEDSSAFVKKGHHRTRSLSATIGASSYSAPSRAADSHTPTKLKVATLSPAPHHPKVVCQLQVPFPLPDVEVDSGSLKKRFLLADGTTRSTISPDRLSSPQMLTLTAEEIKDIVCCTALWLVVREAVGGVGKVSRKGDGFRLRK